MFERFTESARQVVVSAQNEARALHHNYIGTEHLLLGLFDQDESAAARILDSFDIDADKVRAEVARIVGQGDEALSGQIPFTPRAKKTLELSLREALSLGHNYIGTEHVLLGLARENEGVAARILADFGLSGQDLRDAVIAFLSSRSEAGQPEPHPRGREDEPRSQRRGPKFEHQVLRLGVSDLLAPIERAAGDGWELVSVIPDPEGGQAPIAFLKRPRRRSR